jgi:translation elongation factor EF-4
MGKQANIRNVSVTALMDNHGKAMLQDFLIRAAGIIVTSTSKAHGASDCVDNCITLKSTSHNV